MLSRSILCQFWNAHDLSTEKTEISNCKLISRAALTDVLTTFCFINAFMLDLSHCAQTFAATCLKKFDGE